MTWLELARKINRWTEDQKNADVLVFLTGVDDYFSNLELKKTDETVADLIDYDCYYLEVDG